MIAPVPLRVEFAICNDIVLTNDLPIHLDALLAWAQGQELESQGCPNPWAATDLDDCLDRCMENSDRPVWCASQIMIDFEGDMEWRTMIRKTDPEAMMNYRSQSVLDMRANKVNLNSGQHRGYLLFTPLRHAKKAVAWCMGDPDILRRRLGLIRHLGKMGRNGHGTVTGVTLIEDDRAEQMWRYRTIPDGVAGVPGLAYGRTAETICFPYWNRAVESAWSPIEDMCAA
jgi:CRISPR type IV-associated protein Csf3